MDHSVSENFSTYKDIMKYDRTASLLNDALEGWFNRFTVPAEKRIDQLVALISR